jgi:hypothetical protein
MSSTNDVRLDRINLLEFLSPRYPAVKVMYASIIQDAAANYLYAFLSKNSTSSEEFFSAWQYFFKITSTDNKSWNHHRTIKQSYLHNGERTYKNHYLNDNELRLMCFDKHYEFSGLSELMHIDKFRAGLKTKRRQILMDNWEQVKKHIDYLYAKEVDQIANKQPVPLQVWSEDLMTVLIDPPTPLHLANILYVPTKWKKQKRAKSKINPGVGKYQQLVKVIESNVSNPLESNWGPLAELGVK